MEVNTKLLEKVENIEVKMKQEKLNTMASINKYGKLLAEYSKLTTIIYKGE